MEFPFFLHATWATAGATCHVHACQMHLSFVLGLVYNRSQVHAGRVPSSYRLATVYSYARSSPSSRTPLFSIRVCVPTLSPLLAFEVCPRTTRLPEDRARSRAHVRLCVTHRAFGPLTGQIVEAACARGVRHARQRRPACPEHPPDRATALWPAKIPAPP